VINSVLSGGCIVSGAVVRDSLLFTGARVHPGAQLEETVVLPGVEIARSVRLRKVIVDRGVRIPEGLVVGEDPHHDAQRFRCTESGVCLITQPMLDRLKETNGRASDF
jgi:glucose-1-phosphate adenylyltransferase